MDGAHVELVADNGRSRLGLAADVHCALLFALDRVQDVQGAVAAGDERLRA